MSEKSFAIKEGANPPPRAGRTPFEGAGNSTNPLFIRHFEASALSASRQFTAEHDANVSLRGGETTGNRFPSRSDLIAATFMVAVALLCAVAWITAALLAARYAPPCGPQDISTISGVRLPNCGPFTFNTAATPGARR